MLLFLRLYPVAREQRRKVVLIGHAGQALEHPFEVGKGIVTVTPDLLDEGVDDRAAPAGAGTTDESSRPEGFSPSGLSQNRT